MGVTYHIGSHSVSRQFPWDLLSERVITRPFLTLPHGLVFARSPERWKAELTNVVGYLQRWSTCQHRQTDTSNENSISDIHSVHLPEIITQKHL